MTADYGPRGVTVRRPWPLTKRALERYDAATGAKRVRLGLAVLEAWRDEDGSRAVDATVLAASLVPSVVPAYVEQARKAVEA